MRSDRPSSPPADRVPVAAGHRDLRRAVGVRRDRPAALHVRSVVPAGAASCRRRRAPRGMIGPAGPTWWRVPLALLDHVARRSRSTAACQRQAVEHHLARSACHASCSAGIVGAMLSIGGASYQGVFRNPLVDPYLLGAAAGAGLGATLMFAMLARRGRGVDRRPGAGRRVRRSPSDRVRDLPRRRVVRWQPHRASTLVLAGVAMIVADHSDPDVRAAAQHRGRPGGLHLDPRAAVDGDVGRRAAGAAVRDRELRRAAAPPPSPRPVAGRRRRGDHARDAGGAGAAGRRRRRDARARRPWWPSAA